MSGVCGVYVQHTRRGGAGKLPCAREKHNPQTPQTPGQRLEKPAGFGVGAKPPNPATLRGLRVMRDHPCGI
jgi:hypothetical protein